MKQEIKDSDLTELIENVSLSTKRLNCILKLIKPANIDFADKSTICHYAEEIAYNIHSETQNISLLIAD